MGKACKKVDKEADGTPQDSLYFSVIMLMLWFSVQRIRPITSDSYFFYLPPFSHFVCTDYSETKIVYSVFNALMHQVQQKKEAFSFCSLLVPEFSIFLYL